MLFISRDSLDVIIDALKSAALCDSVGVRLSPGSDVSQAGYEIAALAAVTSIVTTWTGNPDIVLSEDVQHLSGVDGKPALTCLDPAVNPFK